MAPLNSSTATANIDAAKGHSVDLSITTPLPTSVTGSMDGEKPPANRIEQAQAKLEPYKQRCGHYLTKMRPWREFLKLSRPEGDKRRRLEANLSYYQINYSLVFLILMITSILQNPRSLIVIASLVLVWMAFLRKNDDPNWQVVIANVELGNTQRWLILCTITAIVFLSAVGPTLFHALFCCTGVVIVHAILHAPPDDVQGHPDILLTDEV